MESIYFFHIFIINLFSPALLHSPTLLCAIDSSPPSRPNAPVTHPAPPPSESISFKLHYTKITTNFYKFSSKLNKKKQLN